MDTNKENNKVVIIKREHDKISILENIIQNINDKCITEIETIISNLIDSIIDKQNNIQHFVNALKKYVIQPNILNIIIELSISIANQTPYQMFIKNDK
jgi:hypothetical protein